MIVTIRKWRVNPETFSAKYDEEPVVQKIYGETVSDCMASVLSARNANDLTTYTPVEIINIEEN